MTKYEFGTYDKTPEGKIFRVIAHGKYDSDAQAELNARHVLEDDRYDLDGELVTSICIRRGGSVWSVR